MRKKARLFSWVVIVFVVVIFRAQEPLDDFLILEGSDLGRQPMGVTPASCPQPANDSCARVLIIGNSHTFTNDLPGMFAGLARSGGHEVSVGSAAKGGYTLERHLEDRDTQDKLDGAAWDFVVLQESILILTTETARNTQMAPALGALDEKIHSKGAQTILVMIWASLKAVEEEGLAYFAFEQERTAAAMQRLVQGLDILMAPVGSAWVKSLLQKPEVKLWGKDNHHPSPAGTYLMACVLYATIFRQSPVGLSFTADLPQETALFLQGIADKATDHNT